MKWKFYSLAFVAGMSILTACSSDDNNDNDGNGGNGNGNEIENGTILKGTITSDVTLAAGNTYKLSGEYIVEEGATLHIEEGVKIIAVYDDIADYILVKQGGKINAVGTPDKPIVMTSEKEEPGAWGGIHICGRAHTNAEGGKGSSEIGGAVYGGNDDADNSGTLQYIRLEYTGFAFDEEHEANGISFYGVGNGTIVDHCQAYKGSDDGFEFFGGISHGVEKRSHVRSRIIANALADQIRQSDSVIIMGHRQSDLDAIGSAIGQVSGQVEKVFSMEHTPRLEAMCLRSSRCAARQRWRASCWMCSTRRGRTTTLLSRKKPISSLPPKPC